MRNKAGMKFDCIFEEPLDFIDIDYTHLNKTVRYENRPHGEWEIHSEHGRIYALFCSRCKKDAKDYISGSENWWINSEPNFCPNCGADMRKEGEAE